MAGVDPAGPASEAGIQPGDVIVSVNRTKVADGDELKAALERTPAGRPALLLIERRGQPAYIPLERPLGASPSAVAVAQALRIPSLCGVPVPGGTGAPLS